MNGLAQIFYRILKEIADNGLLSAIMFSYIQLVEASANKRKFEKKIVRKETRTDEAKVQEELKIVSITGKSHFHLISLKKKK